MISTKEELGIKDDFVIVPPVIDKKDKSKVIFLAGPIKGAIDWQKKAIEELSKHNSDKNKFKVANPRKIYKEGTFNLDKQIAFESYYLKKASETGVILFWLAKEHEHFPERAYAETTRFELSEWLVKQKFNSNIKIALGIEEGFSGSDYIVNRIKSDYDGIKKVCKSFDELIKHAIELL